MVRAKFRCEGKTGDSAEGGSVTLFPVVGGSAENDEFYRWTPGGSVQLSTVNGRAFDQFEVGKQYYVDFTPAE